MEIKRILAPVDGSDYMKHEIGWACTFAKLFSADLTLLHIVAMPVTSELSGMPIASKQLEEAGRQILAEAASLARSCGIEPKIKIDFSVGNPGVRITKIAQEESADLIVIGAKGKSRIRELLMGSVANAVVNNASCLVLVVHSCGD